MNPELLKSFLVGLGFGVDDASYAKFNKAIATATLRVAALYGSIEATTGAVAFGITKISQSFEDLGYEYKIIAPAINKALILRQEMLKAYRATGVNLVEVVQNALKLNLSLTKTKYAFEALYKSVASRFFTLLTKQSDLFRKRLYDNLPKIQNGLERFVKFLFGAFEAASILGGRFWSILGRVYDIFVQLDHATNGWSTKILAAIAAWQLLNLSFLATPLGAILAGLIAILALFDDFKTFQEGGQSLFNWSKFIPVINAVTQSLKLLWGVIVQIGEALGALAAGFYFLFFPGTGNPFDALTESANRLWGALKGIVETAKQIALGSLPAIGTWLNGLFSNSNVAPNLANAPGGVPSVSPVGAATQNSRTNQNVSQQTQINIQGVADAGAAGKAVSSEQGKVNFDLVRNLKGATTP